MNPHPIITDDTLRETIQHGSGSYPFAYYLEDIWEFDFHCIDWHWHHELEFVTVTEGTALCLVGTDKIRLPKGWGLFINSGVLHRFEADATAIIPNILFSPALLSPEGSLIYETYVRPAIKSAVPCLILDPKTEWQRRILDLLDQVYSLHQPDSRQEPAKRKELNTLQLLLKIWDLLSPHLSIASPQSGMQHFNHRQARLLLMMQYIHDHYRDSITLEDIAASASVSKSSALQIFQSDIHISPVSYLIRYRLMQAANLLHTTAKPVAAIAEDTGFASAGYFCRKFRERYKMSPGEYRRKKS